MMPDKNKDITQRMAELLRKHSLPYQEGAWERFKDFEASKRKKFVLWPYLIGAAAMILIAFTLFLNNRDEENADPNYVATSTNSRNEVPGSEMDPSERTIAGENVITQSAIPPVEQLVERKLIAKVNINSTTQLPAAEPAVASTYTAISTEPSALNSTVEEATAVVQPSEMQALTKGKAAESKSSVKISGSEAFQTNQDANSAQYYASNENSDASNKLGKNSLNKWNFSVEVSPNFMENRVNFGGGVAVAYNVSNKISISSGVSFVQLSANRNPNQPAEVARTSFSSYNYSKSLNGVNTSLTGLDIPINFKLSLNEKLYASAGISIFNVLNESRYNSFEERITEMAYLTTGSSSNQKAVEPVVHTVYSQEVSSETPYEGKNFTGFLNLSVGYKLPFLEKLNLAIEPYVKIPVGSLSKQDMDLGNGGLKIITSF